MIRAVLYQPEAFARYRTPAEQAGLIALLEPHKEQPMTPSTFVFESARRHTRGDDITENIAAITRALTEGDKP